MTLVVVGHLGLDVVTTDGVVTERPGGSLFHFLNGYALSGDRCRVVTWTSRDLLALAAHRLPERIVFDAVEVERPPRFEAIYAGEQLTDFRIHDVTMPGASLERVRRSPDLHLAAMPVGDVLAIVDAAAPERWTMQLHSSVLPTPAEFGRLPTAPSQVFCNADEFEAVGRGSVLSPGVEWIVTGRDRVEVHRDDRPPTGYGFEPAPDVVEATGAGDVFAGAVVGAVRRGVAIRWAVRFGVGAAALSISAPSSEAFAPWWQGTGTSNAPD